MPIVAATLLDAVAFTNSRTDLGNTAGLLFFYISTFNNSWAPNFNPNLNSDRPIRNWIISSRITQDNTPTTGSAQQKQAVVDAAVRVLYAANAAFTAGRITTAQRDAVLAAWNSSFGAVP